MRYLVVTHEVKEETEEKDQQEFEDKVSGLLRNGFKCVGGVSTSLSVTGVLIYSQALLEG
jgi:hypothetical protein